MTRFEIENLSVVRPRESTAAIPLIIASTLLLILPACSVRADTPRYKDAMAPIDQRVDDLLSRMTLDEKVQQLRCIGKVYDKAGSQGVFDPAKAAKLFADGMGEIGPIDFQAAKEVAFRNAVQEYLVRKTRLGIPAIFHDEACHGFRDIGATSFPVPIGLACAWDPELMRRIYSATAGEMRARGVSLALAPVVDIDRDPRWGRTDETMGEDPISQRYPGGRRRAGASRQRRRLRCPGTRRRDAKTLRRPRPTRGRHQSRPRRHSLARDVRRPPRSLPHRHRGISPGGNHAVVQRG